MSRREIVHRGFDPIFTQVLCDLLQQEGLDAQLRGAHASAIFGAGQSYLAATIDTPVEQAARARELLAAYQQGDEEGPAEQPAGPIIAPEVRLPRPRKPWFAPGLAALLPGGGHLFAFRGVSGVAVLCAQIGVLVMLLGQGRRTAAALAVSGIFLFDAIGGYRATSAYNRGVRVGAPQQLAVVLLAVAAAVGVGLAAAPWVNSLRMPRPVGQHDQPGVRSGAAPNPADLPFPMHLDLDGRPARR